MARRTSSLLRIILSAFVLVALVPVTAWAGMRAHNVPNSPVPQDIGGPEDDFAQDHILVKFRDDLRGIAAADVHGAMGTTVQRTNRLGYDLVEVPEGSDVRSLVDEYNKRPEVEVAEPDYIRQLLFTPNDTNFGYQWNFDANHLNMPAAWDEDQTDPKYGGDPSVVVAVIDTGVAYETSGVYAKAPDFENTNFVAGYDFVNGDANPNDDFGHGTHVAMTIAESTNNSSGEAGIAFNTSIMPIKVLNVLGFGTLSDIADGIDFATDNGADIINLSLGGYSSSSLEEDAIERAVAAGVIVVAAVGNGDAPSSLGGDGVDNTGDPVVIYPAAFPGVIGVGAVGYDRKRSPYSNYGTGLDIVAPGGDTTVDRNGDGYADGILQQTFGDLNFDGFADNYTDFYHVFYQGTSMAAPHVSGAAALLLADGLAASSVESRLTGTAQTDMSGYSTNEYGAGMLDAAAMFNPSSDVTPPQPVTGLSAPAGNEQVTLNWDNPGGSDFAGVRIWRKTGSAPSAAGDGTLVYEGNDESTTNSGLANNTTYYYGVFSHDSVDNYSVGVSASSRPVASAGDTTAPSDPDDFTASATSSTAVRLTWDKATESDVAGTIIRRSTVVFPSSSTDGELVYDGTGESVTDSGLIEGSTYFYTAFSYDNSGNISDGLSAVETPGSSDADGPTPVSGETANVGATSVQLSWTNPFNADFSHVLITRKEGSSASASPTDGTVVFTSSGSSFTDTDVVSGTTYTYSFYAYDTSGNTSSRVSLSVTAGAASLVTAPGQGGGPHVRAFSTSGVAEPETNFFAYAESFRGGVRLAAGDIDADGVDEIIAGAGVGGGPQIRVFEKDGTVKPIQFFAFHPDFRGGIDVAAGDVDGDGKDELAACQFSEGQAWVKVYRYNNEQTVLSEFNAFGAPEIGCTVAMGDIDKDGSVEIIVGAGVGGGPQIRVFETDGQPKPIQFFAFHPDSRSGIDVSAGDADGDGKDEIIVSQLQGEQAWVKTYRYNTSKTILGEWNAYGDPEVGASVAAFDIDADGLAEVVTGPGPGGGPHVRAFEADGTSMGGVSFFPYDSAFRGGVNVAPGIF